LFISFIDALQKVHGLQAACPKKDNAGYEVITFKGEMNLNAITDHAEHRVKRIWIEWLRRIWFKEQHREKFRVA
jgi:hypothetical protein